MIARLALIVAVLASIGCKAAMASREAKESTAEGAYLAEHLRCVDREPTLPIDAPEEARRAANIRIDACRAKARGEWRAPKPAAGGAR